MKEVESLKKAPLLPWDRIVMAVWLPLAIEAVTGHLIDQTMAIQEILKGQVKINGVVSRDPDMALGAGEHDLSVNGESRSFVVEKLNSTIELSRHQWLASVLTGVEAVPVVDTGKARVTLDADKRILNVCLYSVSMCRRVGVADPGPGKLYTSCISELD